MRSLENRIPPLAVTLIVGVLMWLVAMKLPSAAMPILVRLPLGFVLMLVGLGLCLAGVISFRRAHTTVNPLAPESASTLVESGIYQYTRNPMYLGFAIILIAWSLALASPLTLFGVVSFVLYMNHFQIYPEERALEQRFNHQFSKYCSRVRRWV